MYRILLMILILPFYAFPQGRDNLWLSGYQSGGGPGYGGTNIDFNYQPPHVLQHDRAMNFYLTCADIADTNGNLLFYTNGCYIANRLDSTLFNGTDFNNGSTTIGYCSGGLPISQGAIIIPSPKSIDQYYLFSLSAESVGSSVQPLRLTCSLVDMTLDGGLGGLVWKDSTVIYDTLCMGQLTACKHGNGRDWWISIPEYKSNCYYFLLVTPNGISLPIKQCIGQITGNFDWSGQSVFSPDGSSYARYDIDNGLQLFSFNRCTGIFSDPLYMQINDSAACGGVAFSSNSTLLYVSSLKYVYQYDLAATNILSSKTTVAIYDGYNSPYSTTFFLEQLAPDGKIYINSNNGNNVMHRINYPNNPGIACSVEQHVLQLPTYNAYTMPNFPVYELGRLIGSSCDSLTAINSYLNKKYTDAIIYPNPAENMITVKQKTLQVREVSIYNLLGRKILNQKLDKIETTIDISSIDQGIYIIGLEKDNYRTYIKLVKH